MLTLLVNVLLLIAPCSVDAARVARRTEGAQEQRVTVWEAGQVLKGGVSGPYELQKKLGSGAYGVVYLAIQVATGRTVVVKQIKLTPEGDVSFKNELRMWQHMSTCNGFPHVNVIEYVEVYKAARDMGAVVMEIAGGGTLSDRLYDGVSAESTISGVRTDFGTTMLTSEDAAREMFGQIGAGVQWLANCGIIHKDLKPDNIGFTASGVPKILDFGLAALVTDRQHNGDANMYYNMEQAIVPASDKDRAVRFDAFAMGMLFAEIGTGVPPFFNPPFDYYSTKEGNLKEEKGLLYVTETKKNCAKGDTGLWGPKRRLSGSATALQESVGEVAGRQFYYLEKGFHYMYKAGPGGGGQAIPRQYAQAAWLFQSSTAMDLLASLMNRDSSRRTDLRTLTSHPWFTSGEDLAWDDVRKPVKPHPKPKPEKKPFVPQPTPEKPKPKPKPKPEKPRPTGTPQCTTTPQKVHARSKQICRLSNPTHEKCMAPVSCENKGTELMMVEMQAGYDLTSVRGCYNCQPQPL